MRASGFQPSKFKQPPFTQARSPPLAPRGTGSEATDGLSGSVLTERSSIYNSTRGAWDGRDLPAAVRWLTDPSLSRPVVWISNESMTFLKQQN